MSDPFASSHSKITWVKQNLTQFDVMVGAFIRQQNLYEFFTETDPQNPQHIIHKMRLSKQIPDEISLLAGNIIDDLRSALDHAIHGIAFLNDPDTKVGEASFPFSSGATYFENTLKGRCKGVLIKLWPLLRSFKPYKGGNDLLFALNVVSGTNKHGIILPVATSTVAAETIIEGEGFRHMPASPVWDWTKQEMELFTSTREPKFKANFKFACYIAFGEVGTLAGKNAIETLKLFADMVETIVNEIEAESKRLGIVK